MDNIKPDTVEHGLSQTTTEGTEGGFPEPVADTTGNTGSTFASAVESVMDVSPGLRFIGTLAGLESPAMRREKRAEQMGNLALARAQADFEDYQNMRPMRNQLAIQSLYEQQYRATVDPIAERISRGVAKEYGQLQMSPKAWNQWKESQSYKNLVATQTALGMLKDNNPAVVRAGTEYARRLGVNIFQQDGKTYFDASAFGVRGELTPETEKQFIELGEKLAMQDAAAFEKMEQRNKRIDGYVMNKTVNSLIAKTGMSHREAYQISESVFSQFPPQDRLYYCGLSGARELMQGGRCRRSGKNLKCSSTSSERHTTSLSRRTKRATSSSKASPLSNGSTGSSKSIRWRGRYGRWKTRRSPVPSCNWKQGRRGQRGRHRRTASRRKRLPLRLRSANSRWRRKQEMN